MRRESATAYNSVGLPYSFIPLYLPRPSRVGHLMFRSAVNGVVVRYVQHTKPFVGELTDSVLIDELMHFLSGVQEEGERVSANFKFYIIVV